VDLSHQSRLLGPWLQWHRLGLLGLSRRLDLSHLLGLERTNLHLLGLSRRLGL
jgi:hypothetical protein